MRTYSQISVQVPEDQYDLFLARFAELIASKWRRDAIFEERCNEITFGGHMTYYVRREKRQIDAVFRYSEGTYKLSNIITGDVGISQKEHSRLVAELWDKGVGLVCQEMKLKGEHIPGKEVKPEEQAGLPPGVVAALYRFAISANKSDGSMHPDDMALWCEFLALLHGSGVEFDNYLLEQYLLEKRFDEDTVGRLSHEKEVVLCALATYDQFRKSEKKLVTQ
jgi:hypothetical protein